MNITLTVSEDNECTESPWWVIVDPHQNMGCDPHYAAEMVTGPFFSRKEAQDFLTATRYNFGPRAVVYCKSGYYSHQYKWACRLAQMPWHRRIVKKLTALSLLLIAVPAYTHLGPDEGLHHFLGQLCGLWPFVIAIAGMALAKLRR